MKNSLKRFAAILLTLVMLVGCASALAETTAFEQNLRQRIAQTDLTKQQLVLTGEKDLFGSEFTVSAQSVNGVADCLIQAPGANVEVQTDGQTLWVSDGTNVYAVALADIQHLFEDYLHVNPFYRFLSDSGYRLQQTMSLMDLVQKTVATGITASADGKTITVDLTGRQILDGLADWLDSQAETAADERTMHFLGLIINAVNSVQPNSGIKSADDAMEQAKEMIHQLTEQLRNADGETLLLLGLIRLLWQDHADSKLLLALAYILL